MTEITMAEDEFDTELCPICLESLPLYWDRLRLAHKALLLPCCGKYMCRKCQNDLDQKLHEGVAERRYDKNLARHFTTCMLCNANLARLNANDLIVKKANDGIAWAQFALGKLLTQPQINNAELDEVSNILGVTGPDLSRTLLQYLIKSADQGYANAQYQLAMLYDVGEGGLSKDDFMSLQLSKNTHLLATN